MAEDSIKLEVVTPMQLAVSTEVSDVSAPSVQGEFGVLPGHRPLLAALEYGRVMYHEGSSAKLAAVAPGFAEVGPDRVVLLVEHWVPASDIDIEDVRDELARAELKVKELLGDESTADYEQALRDEKWASVRLEVAEKQREV
jgi:F-type H+-transporting ATPase subunit epsilon